MNTYLNQPCDRCGAKRKVGKTWKEKVPNMTGTTLVEFSQIICTNKACQEAFDKSLLEETKKRAVLKEKKEASDKERKANSLLQAKKTRKNTSRI